MFSQLIGRHRRRGARSTHATRIGHRKARMDHRTHRCGFERLEDRCLLSIDPLGSSGLIEPETFDAASSAASALFSSSTPLDATSISGNTGEKPQSKVWSYDDTWFSVFARDGGTWLSRLDSLAWTPALELASGSYLADVTVTGDVAHVLLEKDSRSKLASVQYVPGSPGTYQFWSQRPSLAGVDLSSSAETARSTMKASMTTGTTKTRVLITARQIGSIAIPRIDVPASVPRSMPTRER